MPPVPEIHKTCSHTTTYCLLQLMLKALYCQSYDWKCFDWTVTSNGKYLLLCTTWCAVYQAYEQPTTSHRTSHPSTTWEDSSTGPITHSTPSSRRPVVVPTTTDSSTDVYHPGRQRKNAGADILRLENPEERKHQSTLSDMEVMGYGGQRLVAGGDEISLDDSHTERLWDRTYGYEGSERPTTSRGRRRQVGRRQQQQQHFTVSDSFSSQQHQLDVDRWVPYATNGL